MPVPFADVVYGVPYEAFVGPSTKGGFVGRETIDGVACAHLSYADAHVGVEVWIPSSGQPLPRRVELVYKRVSGEPRPASTSRAGTSRRWWPKGRSPSSREPTPPGRGRAVRGDAALRGPQCWPHRARHAGGWLRGIAVRVAHFRMRGAVVSMKEDR